MAHPKSIRPPAGFLLLSTAVVLLTGCAGAGAPIVTPASPTPPDPPARVARVSFVSGNALLRLAGTDDWVTAGLNRPLTSGDSISTGPAAHLELHTGNAAIRFDASTAASLLEIGTNVIQLKLTQGTAALHIRELDENEEVEIDTPDAAISLLRAGEYRIDVSAPDPGTTIIVRSGLAEISGTALSFVLRQNQQARIPGLSAQAYSVTVTPPVDSFDAFCQQRTQREDRALASKRLPPRLIGYEDLDEYGDWNTDPTYGTVWFPRSVPPAWVPYGFGHWVWLEPWGWTWIDDTPWGFAPFHYGRWAHIHSRWGWVPGPFHHYPVYAPALVVFVGGGGPGFRTFFRIGVGLGVAWFPLGPHEIWFPPYRASRTYVTNVNITHTVIRDVNNIHHTNIERQHYANQRIGNALTAVPEDAFRRAQPVQRSAVQVSPLEAGRASISGAAPPVAPSRESLNRADQRAAPQPPPPPVPFEQRRKPTVLPRQTTPQPQAKPRAESRRDQQWDRRSSRSETSHQKRVEGDRRQSQRTPSTPRRPD